MNSLKCVLNLAFQMLWIKDFVMKSVRQKALFLWRYICGLINRHPADIVQFFPLKGYYLLCLVIYLQITKELPDEGWNDSSESLYTPPPTKPNEAFNSDSLDPEITFVTAYFSLGRFKKGDGDVYFDVATYSRWMNQFANFNNNVIAFTDVPEVAYQLFILRKHLPKERTKIFMKNQDDMWAFKLAPKIKNIFAQPDYPKYHPNTVLERYPCAMHAKYELIETVIRERMFHTKYLAWIDIGYFRDNYGKIFHLDIPSDFRNDHIAFLQMGKFERGRTASSIIKDNIFWIAGGILIARPEYLIVFIEDYKRAVENLISRNLMSTDQQVIYIMYTKAEDMRPRLPVQTYSAFCKCDWFYLGKRCIEEWRKSLKPQSKVIEAFHRNML
ncbi:hypothetical protein KP79_PYT20639 [Mizuhopecten yessoensis]|uniref:Uncharacterized protein n=2 Tax=Mizuhopecten yessoensis TaxID=6573 RepID=A0A210QK53_MIZYE|nr:hypothetical protein KP79_PYT20639 [Mizuhopecten yessoensis]